MEKGTFLEILTPREMPRALSLSIASYPRVPESENQELARDPVKGAMLLHLNGARRLTGIRVVAPSREALPPSAAYLSEHGLVEFDVGGEWLLDVTLDDGKRGITRDLRPDLPMVIRF